MKNLNVIRLFSFLFMIGFVAYSHANLLSDPDGFSVSMTTSASATNIFGPPSFTDNFDPAGGFGNAIEGAVTGGTLIEVSFFTSYIEIRQFATSTFDPTTLDWLMLFDSIDTTSQIISASVDDVSNTFVDMILASSTSDSISISFAGGSTDTLAIGSLGWFARIDVEFGQVVVASPATGLFLALGLLGIAGRRRQFTTLK
jgi:hypothetical protein